MKDIKTIVAKNILFYRKQKRFSQKTLADKIGVKHNTISSWESCINSVDIDSLFKICNALDISVNTMLGIDECSANKYTDKEKAVIQAYRTHPEMQQAVDKMLDIDRDNSVTAHIYNIADMFENSDTAKVVAYEEGTHTITGEKSTK